MGAHGYRGDVLVRARPAARSEGAAGSRRSHADRSCGALRPTVTIERMGYLPDEARPHRNPLFATGSARPPTPPPAPRVPGALGRGERFGTGPRRRIPS